MDHRSWFQAVMRARSVVTITALVGLALGVSGAWAGSLARPAKPRVLKLNWVEHRTAAQFPVAMTFKVTNVTLGIKAWSVRGSFTNRSTKAIRVIRHPEMADYALFSFALAVPYYIQSGYSKRASVRALLASYARPTFPQVLRPGQSWSGVFGGPGLPPKGKLINVVFGVFSVPGEPEWSWITTHAFKR